MRGERFDDPIIAGDEKTLRCGLVHVGIRSSDSYRNLYVRPQFPGFYAGDIYILGRLLSVGRCTYG